MTDLLPWEEDTPPATPLAKVERADKQDREAEMLRLEDEIFQEHYDIVRQVAMFKDVDPSEEEPPPDFTARFGSLAVAKKAYRLARSGWMPAKDAPSGVAFAYKVAMGVIKAREENRSRQSEAKPLNVVVVLNQPVLRGEDTHTYQELEVDK